jgi:uroporphyrin-III C-methyltransferase
MQAVGNCSGPCHRKKQMVPNASPIGKVFLVGAGPGHPDLLTVRALRAIEAAHVIVHDGLDSPDMLALVPMGAAQINVGKQAGLRPVPQAEINETLARLARSGRIVVRLKAGDPLVFGRGGEEAFALAAAGIPFEVVPGITAAQACAAALSVPLTQRGVADSVRYLTGHCRAGQALDLDWRGLADPRTTLVVYMGMASIGEIAAELVRHGRSPDTPALAISRATMIDQRWLASSLQTLAADIDGAQLSSPALFIIGEAVSLAHINEAERHARNVNRSARALQSSGRTADTR